MRLPPHDNWPYNDDFYKQHRMPLRPVRPDDLSSIELEESWEPRSSNFACVYKARDTSVKNGRFVAVKVPHFQAGAAEAATIATLRHPNIIIVHRTEPTGDGRRAIITEWLDGGSLADQLAKEPRTILTAWQWAAIFELLARALDYVHAAINVHRDIKPGNILFANDGENWFQTPKLADFGLTVSGTVGRDSSGTRSYQDADQRDGKPSRFSDVYALGVTLWQCLTGEQPPVDKPLAPPTDLQEVPKTLVAILDKCLDPKPIERYGTKGISHTDPEQHPALELAKDLRRFLDNQPTLARPLNLFQRTVLWVRREPWQAATVAVLGVGLAVSAPLAWHLWQSLDRERTEHERAERESAAREAATKAKLNVERKANIRRYALDLQAVQKDIERADPQAAVAHLRELKRISPTVPGWEWEYLFSQCNTAREEITFAAPVQGLAVDAKGHLAVAVAGGKIHVGTWNRQLPIIRPVPEPEQRVIRRMWFTPQGLLTASSVRHRSVVAGVLDLHSLPDQCSCESVRELFLPGETVQDGPAIPALSPDMKTVAFPGNERTLKLFDLGSGKVSTELKELPPIAALAFHPDGSILAVAVGQEVRFWSLAQAESPETFQPLRGNVRSLAYSSDGTLALIHAGSRISLWKYASGWKPAGEATLEPRDDIHQLVFSPKRPSHFVTLGRTLTLWSLAANGLRRQDLLSDTAALSSVAFLQREGLSGGYRGHPDWVLRVPPEIARAPAGDRVREQGTTCLDPPKATQHTLQRHARREPGRVHPAEAT